ncbi:hypothetical protein N7478_004073 [Penicillium angulare]|uniref:uncharacterized protein n=1 Tax=Penicillium angulare TaxID=116970 RepID=UPI0025419893|nr:uncharacterized protein N7478_004073 [Penicillium angulare]KAJ5278701.1 hypothetical protein N7478_004073 [Penicillium angulare]
MESNQFKIRKRNPKACRRCHRRKQRCVGYPTCTNCETANSSCTRSDPSKSQPACERYHGLSKDALFDKIEELEAQVKTVTQVPRSQPSGFIPNVPEVGYLFDVMEFLTTGQMSGQTPQTSASPPGTLIAKEMDRVFEETVMESCYSDKSSLEYETEFSDDQSQPAHPNVPTDGEGLKYIRVYMETMHNHMPYLDLEEIYQLHDERSEPIAPNRSARWKAFKLFMVYAVGAATCRSIEPQFSISDLDLLRTALQLKPPVTELRSLQSIEAMMLLIMYNLRIPNSSNIWYMIGLAMRTAIDLGLHREANYLHLKDVESQARRLLFWSVYIMDRSIARLLDRPFNIAEHDIDVGLPFEFRESIQASTNEKVLRRQKHLRSSISVFSPAIRLIRLKSQIQTRVHRVDKEVSLLLPEINPLFSALEEYKRSLQSDLSPIDKDWINMHWNNGIVVLIQPFLRELPSDHELIRTCMRASGQMCQVFKALHQKGYIGFGYFLPCSVDVANDLGACSSVLFAVSERNKQLEKYRDTWEAVLTKVMEHLEQFSYTREMNMAIIRQPSLTNSYNASWMSDFINKSPSTGTSNSFLDDLSSARGEWHYDIWGLPPFVEKYADKPAKASPQLFTDDLNNFSAYQDTSSRSLTPDGKDATRWDQMIPGNLLEESRAEIEMFDELFASLS